MGWRQLQQSARFLLLNALAVSLLSMGCAPPEPTPDFEMLSYPVPIDLEGRAIRSSLFLRMKVKNYNLPLEEFEKRKLEPREAVFAQFIRALRESDYGTVARLVYGREPWEGEIAKVTVETWRDSFGNFEDMTLLSQVTLGSQGVFILGWPGIPELPPGALNRLAFTLRDLPDLQFRIRYVDRRDPLEFFVLYVFRKIRRHPEDYQPVRDPGLPFEYALLEDKTAPLAWQFRGELLDVGVDGDPQASTHEVVQFYQKTLRDFVTPNWEDYLNALTPHRRGAAQRWFERVSPEAFKRSREEAAKGKRLRFLLDADPLFFVFTAHEPGSRSGSHLTYEHVLRDTASGGLRLASREAGEPFDVLFGDPAYFPDDPEVFVARLKDAQVAAASAAARARADAGDSPPSSPTN
jgi:hypothetical protein